MPEAWQPLAWIAHAFVAGFARIRDGARTCVRILTNPADAARVAGNRPGRQKSTETLIGRNATPRCATSRRASWRKPEGTARNLSNSTRPATRRENPGQRMRSGKISGANQGSGLRLFGIGRNQFSRCSRRYRPLPKNRGSDPAAQDDPHTKTLKYRTSAESRMQDTHDSGRIMGVLISYPDVLFSSTGPSRPQPNPMLSVNRTNKHLRIL